MQPHFTRSHDHEDSLFLGPGAKGLNAIVAHEEASDDDEGDLPHHLNSKRRAVVESPRGMRPSHVPPHVLPDRLPGPRPSPRRDACSATLGTATALSVMRRRRNIPADGPSPRFGEQSMDQIGGRILGSSHVPQPDPSSSTLAGGRSSGSPKKSPAPVNSLDATAQEQRQDYNAILPGQNPHHLHHQCNAGATINAMRYNSSLHCMLGGYPMGVPTLLSHPSVTQELIARDRARWNEDFGYGYSGYDCSYDDYYARSLDTNDTACVMRLGDRERDQGLYPHGHGRRSQPRAAAAGQRASSTPKENSALPAKNPAQHLPAQVLTANPRRYLERDYKTDRVWQEDDHTPQRKATVETSNVATRSESRIPSSSVLRLRHDKAVPSVQAQRGAQLHPQHLPGQWPPYCQFSTQRIHENDVMPSQLPAVDPYYQTPHSASGCGPERIRQISDISSVCGSVSGSVSGPPIPRGGVVCSPHPPHYRLIYSNHSQPYQHHNYPHQGAHSHAYQEVQHPAVNPHSAQANYTDGNVKEYHKGGANAMSSPSVAKPQSDAHYPAPSADASTQLLVNTPPSQCIKRVTFSHLQIRTYETILGDNPSCSGGPSLGLGWRYDPSHYTSTIDEYEAYLSLVRGTTSTGEPLAVPPEELVLHRFEREAILLNTGYTRQDLADSVRSVNKCKNRRRQTIHNLPAAFLEERVEVIKRTMKRWILKKDRTRKMYEDWKTKCNLGEDEQQ